MRLLQSVNRVAFAISLGVSAVAFTGCHHNKINNPIANVNSKQPDKVLFDRAEDAIKHGRYDVGRNLLTTMINTYPDSEFVARAKLAIADSWYNEGNPTSYAQAEREYKDFRTFFPNMPEAAEAQMRIADIHYNEMGKPDRDYTQAKRAEDEYRQMIQDYPDHKLTPLAKQRLRDVQEVLAEGQLRVARFYYLRESWPAAIARLKTLAEQYPLYSNADLSLMMLGQAYESELRIMSNPKIRMKEKNRQAVMGDFRKNAVDAYSRLIERYPAGEYADAAAKRLQALEAPVPHATPEAIARNKQEIASRGSAGFRDRLLLNFTHKPDMASAAHVGEPSLEDPRQESAPALTQRANRLANGLDAEANNKVSAEIINDASSGTSSDAATATPATTQPATTPAQPAKPAFENVPENPNPSTSSSSTTTPVNDAPNKTDSSSASTASPATPDAAAQSAPKDAAPDASKTSTSDQAGSGTNQKAASTDADNAKDSSDSSSAKTKRKKHKLLVF